MIVGVHPAVNHLELQAAIHRAVPPEVLAAPVVENRVVAGVFTPLE